jgi:hypothetical protein
MIIFTAKHAESAKRFFFQFDLVPFASVGPFAVTKLIKGGNE